MTDMRIVHLVGRSQRRGAEMVALELGHELDALGHSNRVLALTTGFDGGRDPAIEPLARMREVGSHHVPRLAWLLRRALARETADVLLLHGGSAAQVAAVALPRRGGPLLVWQRILGFPPRVRNPIQRRWWELVANRMDAAVALTPDLGVELRRLGYLGPLWHIANYRTPDRFVDVDRETAARRLRTEVGVLDDDVHLIGFVGHLVEQKQPLRTLDVLEAVLKHGERAHLVVAGDGPLRARLEQEIAMRDLGRDVTLLGQREDVELVYAGVEVTVLTSDAEGIPGVVIEAQMAGCPVVSFPLGGVRDVMLDGETGVVLSRFDTTLMADAVSALLADPRRRASMGAHARARSARVLDRSGGARVRPAPSGARRTPRARVGIAHLLVLAISAAKRTASWPTGSFGPATPWSWRRSTGPGCRRGTRPTRMWSSTTRPRSIPLRRGPSAGCCRAPGRTSSGSCTAAAPYGEVASMSSTSCS